MGVSEIQAWSVANAKLQQQLSIFHGILPAFFAKLLSQNFSFGTATLDLSGKADF
jgi:hypothetical protein